MKNSFFDKWATGFQKISSGLNTSEGLRNNATLSVLAGPSPAELIPAPEEQEIPEGMELPQNEDWEALYGGTETEECGKDLPDDEEEPVLDRAVELDEMELHSAHTATTILGLSAKTLLAGMIELPDCARNDEKVAGLFQRVFQDALDDLSGYEGKQRGGTAAASKHIAGNTFRLVVHLQEGQPPLECEAEADLFVNER